MRLIALSIIVAAAALVQADILHLRNGTRYEGKLIAQTPLAVTFRVTVDDGRAGLVRTFAAGVVASVERTDRRLVDEPDDEAEPGTGLDIPAGEQVVQEGLLLLDLGDRRAGLRALQLAVQRSAPELRPRLDAACVAARQATLAELLALTRVQVAAEDHDGTAFRMRFATRAERPALGRILRAYQAALLAEEFAGQRLSEWEGGDASYDTLTPDAQAMVAHLARAAAVMAARLRFDPTLEDSRKARRELIARRETLVRLGGRIRALPGYTAAGDPAALTVLPPPTTMPAAEATQEAHRGTTAPRTEGPQTPDNAPSRRMRSAASAPFRSFSVPVPPCRNDRSPLPSATESTR